MHDADRRILRVLQRDVRATNLELARQANLSPPSATLERVRRLQRDGVIEGFTAWLNPEKLGWTLLAFVQITLHRTNELAFEDFAAEVRRTPEVLECQMVAGGFDYLIKVRVRDMREYRAFLGDALVRMPSTRQTHTHTVHEEVKNTTDLLP